MRIGTTPTYTFELPFSHDILKKVEIVFAQREEIVLKKTLEDCECDKNTLTLKLSQSETFMFDDHPAIAVQIRALTKSGDVVSSDDIFLFPRKCRSCEVIT